MPEPDDTALGPAPPRGSSADAGRFGHGQFAPGTVLAGRYRVVGLLGRGGMGEVYRADDLTLGQSVAIKLLPDRLDRDPAALARLLEEVRTARQVSHPNVCRVHDVGEVDGRRFLSMEYIDGEDLSILLRRIGHLPQDKGLEVARQICAGLAAAHDRGVLHRDLKPANIMIDGRGRVRITDFGLATALGGDATRAGEVAGTPPCMAPEQLDGRPLSIQSDLYALGLVLFELFTGRRVHDTGDIAPAPVERSTRAMLFGFCPLLVVMVISALAFMRRNLTLGRGDRAGATRLALVIGVATLLSAALGASWPSDGLVQTVMSGALSAALFMAGCCWVFYLAIEPYARRQWPRTLTGWTRFLHGEWRDPLAGRELLVGAATGMALLAVQRPVVGLGQLGRSGLERDAYGSVLGALSVGVNQIGSAVSLNLGWIVLRLLARRITHKDVLALGVPIVIVAALMAAMFNSAALSLPEYLLIFGIVVVRLAVSTVLYLRVGFLALVAYAFTMAVLSVMPLSFTSGSYFAGLAWLAVAVASAPALFGLYTSLAGQSVFFNAPEDGKPGTAQWMSLQAPEAVPSS